MKDFDCTRNLADLTVGEFFELLEKHFGPAAKNGKMGIAQDGQPKHLLYGISGIEKFFGVSHRTAQKYKDGILKPAVRQNGRKIVTDADYALQLFNESKDSHADA